MGYLLSPNTGKELTVLETIRTYYDIPFKLTCEQYTKQVLQSMKINQTTPPKRNIYFILGFVLFIIIAIGLLIKQLKKLKR